MACPLCAAFGGALRSPYRDALRGGGTLAVLVGDVRKAGVLYPISRDMRWFGDPVSEIIKVQHNVWSSRVAYSGRFIELAHDEGTTIMRRTLRVRRAKGRALVVLTRKPRGWNIPVRVTMFERANLAAQSWRNVVQTALEVLNGRGALADIYRAAANHPRAQEAQTRGQDWKAKVRQTLQAYSRVFQNAGRGVWQLAPIGGVA